MSNIVSLIDKINKPKREEYFSDDSELYFPVWELPAYFHSPTTKQYFHDPEHKHITRVWNGNPTSIGLVGKNYKLLKNKDLCHGIEDTLIDTMTREELSGVQRTDKIAYLGGTSIRQYVFPNITADIGSKRSNVAFRVVAVNGYDGSSSFKFYHGAIDFFCSNGMVTGSYDMMVKRHTSGLTIPILTNKLRQSIQIFYKQASQWKHWVGKVISDEDAEQCFKAMPNVSERRVEQLMRQFRIECQSHERTVWALYSAATYYATSNEGEFVVRKTANDHSAATILNREQQVRSWINSDEFNKVAA